MVARPWIAVVVLGALGSLGAQFRTTNFLVNAPTPEMAKRFGEWAEYYRKQKALQWVGREMPTWPQPLPLHIKVTYNGSGGATSFGFDHGGVVGIKMEIQGTLDRLVASVLPHEVTHTVFAYHFRVPVPRWADEGGSVLSEDEPERKRHDLLVREVLNSRGRAIPLRRLFQLTEYPRDVMVLYAEGYSVTNFLVSKKGRGAFLNFIADGMRRGWDAAARDHYGFQNVDDLEKGWIESLRQPQPAAETTLASAAGRGTPQGGGWEIEAAGDRAPNRVVVRQTLPPVQPVLGAPRPVYRGVSSEGEEGVTRPLAPDGWAAPTAAPASSAPPPPRVRLGAPRPIRPPQETGGWNDRGGTP
jgi:hypothetical protein